MNFKTKQKGISLISMIVVILISLVFARAVFYLGSVVLKKSKSTSLTTQILQLKKDIVEDGLNHPDYSHLADQNYLVVNSMVPNEWNYDSVNKWFVTPNGEILSVVNGRGPNLKPGDSALDYANNSGFQIIVRKVDGDQFMEYYKSLNQVFYKTYALVLGTGYADMEGGGMGIGVLPSLVEYSDTDFMGQSNAIDIAFVTL
jgi:hypothetical protein